MTRSVKSRRISEEDCDVDIISSLPINVIDCIMEFMPVRDAARTCVLSSKWRNVWSHHPSLALDGDFWFDVWRQTNKHNMDSVAYFVSSILLLHVGHIRKFVIEITPQASIRHSNIDLWLSSVCKRGLKVLNLCDRSNSKPYEVPSCVFSTFELTDLIIYGCFIKKRGPIECFSNLRSLDLKHLALDSRDLTTPLLNSLTIDACRGMRDFNISAPMLATLFLRRNDFLNLKPFLICMGIGHAILYSNYRLMEDCESVSLVKLLAAWPMVSNLVMNGVCFKHLDTGDVPDTLQLNLTTFVIDGINLDSELTAWRIIHILKNSPLLHTFSIKFCYYDNGCGGSEIKEEVDCNDESFQCWIDRLDRGTEKEEEVHCNEEPSFTDCWIEQLHRVQITNFSGTRDEVMFVKILLRCSAPVNIVVVEDTDDLPSCDRVLFTNSLLKLQREFPRTQIVTKILSF